MYGVALVRVRVAGTLRRRRRRAHGGDHMDRMRASRVGVSNLFDRADFVGVDD